MAHPCATPDNEAWNQPGAEFNQQALAAATGDLAWYDQTEVSGYTEHTYFVFIGMSVEFSWQKRTVRAVTTLASVLFMPLGRSGKGHGSNSSEVVLPCVQILILLFRAHHFVN